MQIPAARFSGRIRLQSGSPAYGCHVALYVTDTPHIVSETWTSSRGEFVLDIPPDRLPPGGMRSNGFTLKVLDGTHSLLVEKRDMEARAGHTTHVDAIADARTMVMLPVALPLTRAHQVPIIRPEALAVVDAAMGLLAPVGSDAHTQYARGARRTLPPPGHVEELLELAWAALDGDPAAMSDLREVLAVQAAAMRRDGPSAIVVRHEKEDQRTRRRPKVSYGQPKDAEVDTRKVEPVTVTGRLLSAKPRRQDAEDDTERRGAKALEGAVLTDRLMPLVVATVRVARSPDERVAFFDGLHGVLSGLSTIDRLHRAALEVLQDRRIAPLRALLALLKTDVDDETDLPLPMPGGVSGAAVDPSLPDLVDPWWERLQEAVHLTDRSLGGRGAAQSPYHIDAILPPDAAPGQRVLLRGRGFGDHSGDVAFDGASPVVPLSWSDTEIEAIVPDNARPGPVSLRVLQHVVRVKHKILEIYRAGTGVPFEGGRPQVRSLLVDGRAEGSWVRPGDTAAVSWTSVAGNEGRVSVRVAVIQSDGGRAKEQVLFADSDLPASGSRIVGVPDVDTEHTLSVTVTVENAVDRVKRHATWPVAVPPALTVRGIEVTQGIQHAPWEDAYGTPVPTVAGKDTIVRVYVTSEREGFQDDQTQIVHAMLRVGDVTLRPLPPYGSGDTFEPGDFFARRAYSIDRSRDDHALIFRIPAPLCEGTRELHVEVGAAGRPPHAPSAEARITWTWTTVRPLPMRFVRMGTAHTAPPSDAQARLTLLRAYDLLPTPPDDIGPAWLPVRKATQVQDGSRDDPAWAVALEDLADMHDVSTWEWLASSLDHVPTANDDTVWVGVVPHEIDDHVIIGSRTILTNPSGVLDDPTSPNRTATARRAVHVLDPASRDAAPARVHEVPFDPYWCTTVVDPRHGVRDLSLPPGATWISSRHWRHLIDTL